MYLSQNSIAHRLVIEMFLC